MNDIKTHVIIGIVLILIGAFFSKLLEQPINPILDLILIATNIAGWVILIIGIIKFIKRKDALEEGDQEQSK